MKPTWIALHSMIIKKVYLPHFFIKEISNLPYWCLLKITHAVEEVFFQNIVGFVRSQSFGSASAASEVSLVLNILHLNPLGLIQLLLYNKSFVTFRKFFSIQRQSHFSRYLNVSIMSSLAALLSVLLYGVPVKAFPNISFDYNFITSHLCPFFSDSSSTHILKCAACI